jgi:integrase
MRRLNRLSDRFVRTAPVGKHHDGLGLLLQVTQGRGGDLNRSWLLRYSGGGGRSRYHGLGRFPDISLSAAREKAGSARALLSDGVDPIAAKHAQRLALRQQQGRAKSFGECAEAYIRAHWASWTPHHAEQWRVTLDTYVMPDLGSMPIDAIDTAAVMRVLEPIWHRIPKSASRLRNRIELILDWAEAREFRRGPNPARWKHLSKLLPHPAKLRAAKHVPSMPYDDLPAFMVALRQRETTGALALQFLILTAARTSEVLGARWSEINLHDRVWVVPAERMKARKVHRVPLSEAAMDVLARSPRRGDYIFPGSSRPTLSTHTMKAMLMRMAPGAAVHGFRATFRCWAAERTNYPAEVAESALAHVAGNMVERAYQRSDMFERRRRLMADWADFCAGKTIGAEVVTLPQQLRNVS